MRRTENGGGIDNDKLPFRCSEVSVSIAFRLIRLCDADSFHNGSFLPCRDSSLLSGDTSLPRVSVSIAFRLSRLCDADSFNNGSFLPCWDSSLLSGDSSLPGGTDDSCANTFCRCEHDTLLCSGRGGVDCGAFGGGFRTGKYFVRLTTADAVDDEL